MKKLIFIYIAFLFFVKAHADNSCAPLKNSQLKLKTHTENISFALQTGGKYSKKVVICHSNDCQIKKSNNKKIVYEPGHPHSNRRGYVVYPDIDVREEYDLVNQAVNDLREISEKGICNTKLLADDFIYTVKYKGSSILKDIFKFNRDQKLISWSRFQKNGKMTSVDYASRVNGITSLTAF
jgi:hypothetical protein